jgi:hypothetical protein
MPNYEATVERKLYVSIQVEANTQEEAEKLARERIRQEFQDIQDWQDYDPVDIEYDVFAPKVLNE